MVDAVCFDLWNTLVSEGPAGLVEARLELWSAMLAKEGHTIPIDEIRAAHQAMFDEFQAAWVANEQFLSADAASALCQQLRLSSSELTAAMAGVFHDAGLLVELHVTEHALDSLDRLRSAGVRTALICDVGLVPTTALRVHLDALELSGRLDALVFSDEVGAYKPDPRPFEAALAAVGDVPPDRAAHVGDRVRTDVAGAVGSGMRAIRFRGIYDDPEAVGCGLAHDVVDDLLEIPALLGL